MPTNLPFTTIGYDLTDERGEFNAYAAILFKHKHLPYESDHEVFELSSLAMEMEGYIKDE